MNYKTQVRTILLTIFVTAGFLSAPAAAHGPCQCLSPFEGPPGTTVRIPRSYRPVEVLWNPDPDGLSNPALAGGKWERYFHRELDTTSLARQTEPGAINFEVPKVPDGRYLVVIFDLSEGGPRHHYTWSTFRVDRSAVIPYTGFEPTGWMAMSLLSVALGLLLVLHFGRSPTIRT
jgi:hypothetical protein